MLAAMMLAVSTGVQAQAVEKAETEHDAYCASVYWEDEENCVDPEEKIDKEFCESLPFEYSAKLCLQALDAWKKSIETKTENQRGRNEKN